MSIIHCITRLKHNICIKTVEMRESHIGFEAIYEGHNRCTWSNYWMPLIVLGLCQLTMELVIIYPVITTAVPGT